jgi:hypothetical protein
MIKTSTLQRIFRLVLISAVTAFGSTVAIAGQAGTPPPPPKPAVAKPAGKNALPAAVEAAFKKAYPNATIKNVSKEKVNGQDEYEIESVDAGLARDLNYKADGTVVLYEEQIAEASVPAAVVTSIKTRYPKATFTRCEKLFKDGTVTYEIALKGAKVSAVVLTPDGQWVSPK